MKYLKALYEAFIANRERQVRDYVNSQRFYY
jgi:hypothetical protein